MSDVPIDDDEADAPPDLSDPFLAHEALDRAYVVSDLFDRMVHEHPFVQHTPELRKQAEQISEAMGTLYQAIGARRAGLPERGDDR